MCKSWNTDLRFRLCVLVIALFFEPFKNENETIHAYTQRVLKKKWRKKWKMEKNYNARFVCVWMTKLTQSRTNIQASFFAKWRKFQIQFEYMHKVYMTFHMCSDIKPVFSFSFHPTPLSIYFFSSSSSSSFIIHKIYIKKSYFIASSGARYAIISRKEKWELHNKSPLCTLKTKLKKKILTFTNLVFHIFFILLYNSFLNVFFLLSV